MTGETVFISHNKADKQAARELAIFLAAEEQNIWFDEWNISAGDSILEKIEDGLSNARAFILVWSQQAKRSKWVSAELRAALSRAISTGRPRVIPVILDDTVPPELLRDIRAVDFRQPADEVREQLVRGVTGKGPNDTLTKSIVQKFHALTRTRPQPGNWLGYRACPRCGSNDLKFSWAMIRDDCWDIVTCQECKWQDAAD